MTAPETDDPAAGAASPAAELLAALAAGGDAAFNPFTGVARGGEPRPFRAADLGLEAPRFCPLCGRRMVAQVYPYGWKARCSRHGEVTSGEIEDARLAGLDPLAEDR